MKNKQVTLKHIENLKGQLKNLQSLVYKGGSYDEFFKSFENINNKVSDIEGLIDLEIDPFNQVKSNQIL